MHEGIGSAFVYSIVITIVGVILLLLVGSIGYSKAFKVNSRIIEVIETYNGFAGNEEDPAVKEIAKSLQSIGYRVGSGDCPELDSSYGEYALIPHGTSNYEYCIYKHTKNSRGTYYTVLTYMYFDFPIIGEKIKLKVTNQTKTLNLFRG